MRVKLVTNDMWSPALEFTLDQFPIVIGRNGKSDVAIDDRWMSETHCELDVVDGQLKVRDLRSEHGTLVNEEAVSQKCVAPGDTLTFGIRSFRVSYRRLGRRAKSSNSASTRRSRRLLKQSSDPKGGEEMERC